MCGICGVFGYKGLREEFSVRLAGMSGLLEHRGPDDSGEYWDDIVGFAHRRLSVIDIEGGRQPMSNEDGSVWIVYNGEVYNFRELRAELAASGHEFRTASDTEVILHLYEEYGTGAFGRLNGMFAFALWDKARRRLVLARDRLGVKPLYYCEAPDGFFFSSELRSLAAGVGGGRRINGRALCRYLLLQYSPAPGTMLEGMSKLQPGHVMVVESGRSAISRYWSPDDAAAHQTRADVADIRRLLEDAVRRQLVSDVPLGAFLSGGVDSGAVVAMMGRHGRRPVKTFSIGFEGPSAFDERPAARKLARTLGTEHHETSLSPVDFVSLLPKVAAAMDEPVADPAAVPTYMLSGLAREHVKVVMTGEGGDELFGGYLRYKLESVTGGLPGVRAACRALNTVLSAWPGARRRHLKAARALSSDIWAEAHMNWVSVFLKEEVSGLAPDICGEAWGDSVDWFGGMGYAGGRLGKMIAADLVSWLPDDLFAKVDRMSMAVSLEARVPYLDYELMDAALTLPDKDRIHGLTTKYALKRSLRGLLPDEVIGRKKKGFELPVGVWFRGPVRDFLHDTLSDGGKGAYARLNQGYVRRMLDEHDTGRRDWALPLFSMLVFRLWSEGMGV